MEVSGQLHAQTALPARIEPLVRIGKMCLRSGLDVDRKRKYLAL
jgi:hypothetical protein